ncbi:MAG TPA: hypothetical protein VK963_02795 [Candidatus Saccharimonadales bacterium]|nr:hypothetical protein [Candidatus Saccharimonadales bacterium]
MEEESKGSSLVVGLVAAVVGLLVGFGGAKVLDQSQPAEDTNTAVTTPAAATPTSDTKAADLRALLNNLESEHVQLAAQATKAGFDGNKNFDAAGKALFANGDNISGAVSSVYGDEAGKKFDQIWDSHLNFFVDYTVAAKKGDKAGMDKAVQNLNGYVEAISDFLSSANPNLPKAAVTQLFSEHVGLLKATVDAHAAGNYPESFAKQHDTNVQVGKIADALAGAVVKQMPEKF